ncbi:hypothetical protein [Sphingobacterium hungaricum]|uniref:hypothetical protein n=1 Tax=Sphingobacterium hungaricum TaxID=2082723 RepID=UPI0018C97B19|nr:hypothetical protein [Sphingobacterium hungaricum]
MNFVSHYYFERYAHEPERVLGSLLPDLLKNADKSYSFQPQRFEEILFANPQTRAISEGWYRHVEVDKLFHNCDFFLSHSHQLRKKIDPVLGDLPIRASFLAHIAIEILLDHLIIQDQVVNVARLYEHLESASKKHTKIYLEQIGLEDTSRYFSFYDRFLQSKYMFQYENIENLSHALFNICKRVWDFQVEEKHQQQLTGVLIDYKSDYLSNYKEVFHYIQANMTYLS